MVDLEQKKIEKEFTPTDTKIIKGLAIVLMLMHHLWAFPDRIYGGNLTYLVNIFGNSSINFLGFFGKICVSIFFFVGGYGIYKSSNKEGFTILSSIKKIYASYWKVFLIFIPIGFIFFSNQTPYCADSLIYARFSSFNWNTVLKNFFGFSSSLNGEWWFLLSYIYAIITFPFIKKVLNKHSTLINIFLLILFSVLSTNLFPQIGKIESLGTLNNNYLYRTIFCQVSPYIACFWFGILFSKDNLLIKLKESIQKIIKLNIFTDSIILASIIYLRQMVVGAELDILYVPLLIIVFLDLIKKIRIFEKIFEGIGKQSTNMWLIHSFYCYYFFIFAKYTVALKWAVPCLIVLIIMSYLSSFIVDYIWKFIAYIFSSLLKLLLKGLTIFKKNDVKIS